MKRFQRMAAVLALLAFALAAGYLFYTCRQSSDIPRPEAGSGNLSEKAETLFSPSGIS